MAVVLSSVELPRFGVLGGVGSDVGAVEVAEMLGRVWLSWCMSLSADDILGQVRLPGKERQSDKRVIAIASAGSFEE